jgi:trehalose 6-phosphate phosphatase
LTVDAREKIRKIARVFGAAVEEKGSGIALHFRERPEYRELVRRAADELAQAYGLRTIHGKMVAEILAAGPNKGHALNTLSQEFPFEGRMPIAVGDDVTDEDAFAAAVANGGFAVLVGEARESNAYYRVRDVASVRAWLTGDPAPGRPPSIVSRSDSSR